MAGARLACLGIAATTICLSFSICGCFAADGPGGVTTAPLRSSSASSGFSILGEVRSQGVASLVAPVTGALEGPFIKSGKVNAGEIVARNVPSNLNGSLASAQANLAFARQQYSRTAKLLNEGAATQANLDQARQSLAAAQGSLDQFVVEAKQQVLRAPVSGSITYLVSPGSVVYKGALVATIDGRGAPWVSALVPPHEARHLAIGRKVELSLRRRRLPGRIEDVGVAARRVGLVDVRIKPSTSADLFPGQWLWIRFRRRPVSALQTPVGALVTRGSKATVYVIDHGKARAVPVEVVAQRDGFAWIQGRLHAGEMVAVSGATRLKNDAPASLSR